jgi:hypothetical protein
VKSILLQRNYCLKKLLKYSKSEDIRGWEGGREKPIELLRSWQLPRKKRERILSLEKLNGGGGGGRRAPLGWPATAASP